MWENRSESSLGEWESSKEEEDGDMEVYGFMGDLQSIKYLYHDATWNKNNSTYDPEPIQFTRMVGSNILWNQVPAMSQLFEIF